MSASAGSASRVPRQDNRRQQLLDAAARLFRERGYHVTSMRDIASEVGMLSGSIYYHFPSKEEMLLAIYEEGTQHVADCVDAAVARAHTPWERLEEACSAHLDAMLELSDYTQVMIRVLPPEGGKVARRLLELRDEYESRFRRLIDALDLPDSADRRYLRLLLMGGLNWSHVWYRPGGDTPADIAHRMVDLLRRSLDPPRAKDLQSGSSAPTVH